jgi:hypothetical protein
MRALGLLVDVDPTDELTRFDYYLPLANVLMHMASAPHHEGVHLEELAHSYAHDILNLSNLASRLLWFEGITPDIWRSHDLVSVDVDTSSYFVTLQTACDIMADAIATLGTSKGQAPTESFHSLTEWVKRNPNRLAQEFRSIGGHLPWFEEINSVRTKLVHRGGDIWIYTDRTRFHWGVHLHPLPKKPQAVRPEAEVAASAQGTEPTRRRIKDRGFLLSDLRRLTRSLLSFSARLARCITRHQDLTSVPRKYVISGAFVPALHHIVRYYEPPKVSTSLNLHAKCLATCGDYATAAYLGYPKGFWWRFLTAIAEGLATAPEISIIPIRTNDVVHDAKLVFSCKGRRCGVILCDKLDSNARWVSEASESARKFAADHVLERTVFVAEKVVPAEASQIRTACAELPGVIGEDAKRVAEGAISELRR